MKEHTPVLDIFMEKQQEPEDYSILSLMAQASQIIRCKIRMQIELNSNIIFKN